MARHGVALGMTESSTSLSAISNVAERSSKYDSATQNSRRPQATFAIYTRYLTSSDQITIRNKKIDESKRARLQLITVDDEPINL